MEFINGLVAQVNKCTEDWLTDSQTIHLYGAKSSKYLRALTRKANKFGLNTTFEPVTERGQLFVVDVESRNQPEEEFRYNNPGDLDNVYQTEQLSCTAEAIIRIISHVYTRPATVCILGRNHSVQKLPQYLYKIRDDTVTVCHTKTENLPQFVRMHECIVNTAGKLKRHLFHYELEDKVIIDVSGSMARYSSDCKCYVSFKDIGRLNTAILINRAKTHYAGGKEIGK